MWASGIYGVSDATGYIYKHVSIAFFIEKKR